MTGLKLKALASTALTVAVLAGSAAYAQVETITVTAQKREKTLQDTPVAVTAVGEAELKESSLRDVRDLQTLVPSLQVSQFVSSANTGISIRNVGSDTFNLGIEPAVGVFVDGVYRDRNGASIGDFLGVERVEVLRGPQSVLFGKNTSAGVLSFITAKPDFEFDYEGELTIGNYDARVVKAGVSGPIVADKLAVRLDVNSNQRDGFVDNVTTGEDVNNRDRWGVRGQLLWLPTDDMEVRLIADKSEISEDCCAAPFSQVSPGNAPILAGLGATVPSTNPFDRQIAVNNSLLSTLESSGLSAEVNIDFDGFTLTSITSKRDYSDSQDIDPDWTDLPLNLERRTDTDISTFTQEVRLTSTGDRMIDWIVGAYIFKQDLTFNNRTIQGPFLRPFADGFSLGAVGQIEALCNSAAGAVTPGCVPGQYFAVGSGLQKSEFEQTNDSVSVFGQADWNVTDKLVATLGLRYTQDEKEVSSDIVIDDPFAAIDLVQLGGASLFAATFGALTGGQAATPANFALFPAQFAAAQAASSAAAGVTCTPTSAPGTCNPFLELGGLQFFPPAPNFADTRQDDDVSGTFILSYDHSDDLNLYASYSRGFKGGGFALDASAARVGQFTFDPETVDAYEVGAKMRLFNNRANLNVAIFEQHVNDFQTNTFTGSSFVPDNAGEIFLRGIEVDVLAQPTDRLTLTGAITYLTDNDYAEFEGGPCPVSNRSNCAFVQVGPAIVPVQDLTDRELSGSAKTNAVATATYRQPISAGMEAFARGEVRHGSDRFLSTDLDPLLFQEAFTLVNAAVGVGHPEGQWALQFWGRNLTDEDYLQGEFNSTLPGNLNAYPGDPQTYGLTLRVRR